VPYPEMHYRWEYLLQASPEALWPYVSDTNHFNHDTGVPAVQDLRAAGADLDNARRHLRLFRLGMPVEWEEEPFEWVRPSRFSVMRRYSAGPLATMRTAVALTSQPGGGTRLVYEVWARPRNLQGVLAIPIQIGFLSARAFGKAFRRDDRMALMDQAAQQQPALAHVDFAPGGQMRLAELCKTLEAKGQPAELVRRLRAEIERADDFALLHMRPYVYADAWGQPRRAVLELFLWATRAGLVDFQWDVLCPLCRGVKSGGSSLKDVSSQVHCEVCQIDFNVNFDRAVELTFRPNPSVRAVDVGEYCIGGPQVTPHIMAQQLLAPGAARDLRLPLEPGRYRARALGLRGGEFLVAEAGGAAEANVSVSDDWSHEEPHISLAPAFHLKNETPRERLFILERMAWSDQAVTAAEVTSLQLFRDLFANEALRPDAQISVGSLTVMFTDLRDSTRLYQQIGDAVAFGHVMGHFDVLREAIAAEDGALVKTIGDAVMAVFRRPLAALHAILQAQQALNAKTGNAALVLKAGIHHGPCIAVTLNDRLDYFGSTVNIAARVQNLSAGDDVVITAAVHDDPEVAQWLVAQGNVKLESFTAMLKGLEDQFDLWRLTCQ
jgi:adenylate cyclase